jgi:hypothetical protein
MSIGYFADRPKLKKPNWKYVLEQEVLDFHFLEYIPSYNRLEKDWDGGVARQVSGIKADVMKFINL